MLRLRSVLYMPGANERALEKAPQIPADALILDLEDAVTPTAKEDARERVCRFVTHRPNHHKTVTIRVNGIGTSWHEADLLAVGTAGPDAVVVPKVSSADDVREIERRLEAAGAPASTEIWAMIETPAGVLGAEEIANASARLTTLVMGTNDLTRELQAEFCGDRSPLIASLSLSVLAARSCGRMILDGVYNDVRDLDGFAAECNQGRALGFDGKTLIHRAQVEACNQAYSPSAEQLDHARRVIQAFEEAKQSGSGVVTVDGRLIENLHVEIARRALARAPDPA